MLPFVLLFVTTMVCSIFSQDSIRFVDRMLEKYNGSETPSQNNTRELLKPPIPNCPTELNASWLLRPPFTTNSSESANEVRGIFHHVFDLALNKCCAKLKAGNKTRINFKTQALNRPQLHDLVLNNDHVHLILPVQSDEDKLYKMTLPFIKILDSPGVVLIQRSNLTRQSSWMMSNRGIWSVISNCLPIIALTILLSFVAGIFVWMMVITKHKLDRLSEILIFPLLVLPLKCVYLVKYLNRLPGAWRIFDRLKIHAFRCSVHTEPNVL